MKELSKRILVALWGVPLVLGLSYAGGYFFLLLVLLINGLALWEFYSIYYRQEIYTYRILGVALSTILLISAFWLPLEIIFINFWIVIFLILFRHLKITLPNSSTATVFTIGGIAYITLFLISLLKFRQEFSDWTGATSDIFAGGRFLVLMWISIWICDTFAYFGGMLLGKHKLAPQTSPHKTVEGAAFGLLGAMTIFIGFGSLFLPHLPRHYFWLSGLVVGVFGQIGDLVESRIKRDAGVKDTSTLLPGHGGFLDRFDSLIFVSPFFFVLFYFLRP